MHREQALSAGWISGSKRFAREYSTLRAVQCSAVPERRLLASTARQSVATAQAGAAPRANGRRAGVICGATDHGRVFAGVRGFIARGWRRGDGVCVLRSARTGGSRLSNICTHPASCAPRNARTPCVIWIWDWCPPKPSCPGMAQLGPTLATTRTPTRPQPG